MIEAGYKSTHRVMLLAPQQNKKEIPDHLERVCKLALRIYKPVCLFFYSSHLEDGLNGVCGSQSVISSFIHSFIRSVNCLLSGSPACSLGPGEI